MRTLIVIPTYNERNTISEILEKISSLRINGLDVLVVDDNSPDGTAGLVENLKKKHANLSLLVRPEQNGLGQAYLAGFDYALARGYETVVQIDADLSHPVSALPDLINSLDQYDLVIGSRYIKGGAIVNWTRGRKLLSYFGCLYARLILGYGIRDYTGGFNAWRCTVLEKIGLGKVRSNGYSFQIEMKYRARKNGFHYHEIPITFTERRGGQSKMSKKIVREAIWRVWWLKFSVK